ncbi:MAG TPA: hypothetical protein VGR53_10040 [Nitrososphaerales archaeon]|nr:hypothetical protein [Nitrososphaerales archaeon]
MKGQKKATLMSIYSNLVANGNKSLTFDNTLVKEVTGSRLSNQFDVTKIDTSAKIPEDLRKEDLFIIHLGGGNHRFVKGIEHGYHGFESVQQERIFEWEYVPSILDRTDESEAGVLSLAFNQQIIQHFLFKDRTVSLRIHLPRRTRDHFKYKIAGAPVEVSNLQIETDFIVERNGDLAVGEAKYSTKTSFFPRDFAVAQVYLPYRRLLNLEGKMKSSLKVRCMFIVQYQPEPKLEAIRIYEYGFTDSEDMASIKMMKNAEYRLKVTKSE